MNWPHAIRTADLDGDKDLDIVAGSVGDGNVVWYESDGATLPSFTQRFIGDWGLNTAGIDTADVNGDGYIDVLVAGESRGVGWYENSGASDPDFSEHIISGTDARSVAAADVNGDGDSDIFAAHVTVDPSNQRSGKFVWYENQGGLNPGFDEHLNGTVPVGGYAAVVVAGDFDNNGNMDVLAQEAGSQDARLLWYENLLPDPEILFEDHFDSPILSPEWVSVKPSQWVEDGWLHTLDTNPGRDSFAVVHDGDTSWTDYTYRITADGLLSMGGTVDDFNLLFRTRDVTYAPLGVDGYYYRLEVGTGGYALWRYNGSATSNTLLFSEAGPFDSSQPIVVTVTVKGPHIRVLFDGAAVIDVIDPEPLLYGGIGIGAVWESEARFDDVVVSSEKAIVAKPMVQCPGDVNGDGLADIAVVTPNGNIWIKGLDGGLVSQFSLTDINTVVDVETMPSINANGSPELVALGTGSVQAEVWDTLTAAQLSLINFNPALTPLDLELVKDQTGNRVPELANLAQGSVKVEVRDGLNGDPVNTVSFSAGFDPMDLEIYPDLNANGSPELAVLGDKTDPTKGDKVEVRDLKTGNIVQNIWLGKGWQVLQQELVADFSGNSVDEVAVLRVRNNDDAVNVLMRDTKTRQRLGSIGFDRNYPPTHLLTISDVNGNGADEVVVFGQRFNRGNQKAQIKDSKTKALIRSVFFDKNFAGQDIATCADINGNGSEELVLLGKRASDGKLKATVKDAKTGELIGVVNF